jgi:two-component system sensor histidine kinase KdpD
MPTPHRLTTLLGGQLSAGTRGYLTALLICAATALAVRPLAEYVDAANVVMLFLLAVFMVALLYGSGPALLAAFLSVALFDFFYVPPHLSFAVDDLQYLITFVVMLTVALITGQLAARWRDEAALAKERERRSRALYEMASRLTGAITLEQVEAIVGGFLREVAGMDARLHLPDERGELPHVEEGLSSRAERSLLERVFRRGEPAEKLGFSGQGKVDVFLPLKAPMRIRGVMEVAADVDVLRRERTLLDTAASLTAIAVERLHYAEVAQATEVKMAGERLRNSVLASLSHDLRTPLTAMVGLAGTLQLSGDRLPAAERDTVRVLHDQALDLAELVNNLLDLARLSSGGLAPRKEWQSLEEVVGAAIKRLGPVLAGHPVSVELAAELPLLEFDAVLLERVVGNLLDNACKHAPADGPIDVEAHVEGERAVVRVRDRGPGFPAGLDLNAAFVRDAADSGRPAAGLGLTIAKAIVEAHRGEFALENRDDGPGGCARFTLPLGSPPAIEEEPGEATR